MYLLDWLGLVDHGIDLGVEAVDHQQDCFLAVLHQEPVEVQVCLAAETLIFTVLEQSVGLE